MICPVDGKCQTKGVIYQATVIDTGSSKTYTGLTSRRFKDRLYEHSKFSVLLWSKALVLDLDQAEQLHFHAL